MNSKFRLLSLAFFVLAASSLCRATGCGAWHNHPVVTGACVVIGWKSKYTGDYSKGSAVPQDNITAITQFGTDLRGARTFGGSFKVFGANGISIRGYINVKVVNGVATQVTFTGSALYRIFA